MIALDTSALLKKYLDEKDSDWVESVMNSEGEWCGSMLLAAESAIVAARTIELTVDLAHVDRCLAADLDRFRFVPVDADCLVNAVDIGRTFGIRMLDAIHLAAVRRLPAKCRLITFDNKQLNAARTMGLKLLVPG